MRLLFPLGILAAVIGIGSPAHAQNYPWCANYGGSFGDTHNCGFVSYEQCMATLSGMGGFCERNNTYVPPPGPTPPRLNYQPWHESQQQR
jgi:hypothetical protein